MSVKNPLRSVSTSFNYDGRVIDVVVATFCDRDLIVVTQLKKLGTLISVTTTRPKGAGIPAFESNVVMGKDEIEYHVFARGIAEVVFNMSKSSSIEPIPSDTGKPLLCTLAISQLTSSLLNRLCEVIKECNVWS